MAFSLGALVLCNHDYHDMEIVQAVIGQSREGKFFAVEGVARTDDRTHGESITISNVQLRGYTTKPLLRTAMDTLRRLIGKTTTRDRTLTITTSNGGTVTMTRVTLANVTETMSPVSYLEGTALRWKSKVDVEFSRLINS
jgi:hypothetical protein